MKSSVRILWTKRQKIKFFFGRALFLSNPKDWYVIAVNKSESGVYGQHCQFDCAFEKCSLVRILVLKDENIVLFQTKSTLGDGEYIVYTIFGNECIDEYMQVVEWISETWYIAKS